MTNTQQPAEKKSVWGVIITIVVVLVAASLVLIIGIWLGRQLSGPEEPVVDIPDAAPDTPYVVSDDYVNVRSGPSTDYPVYGVASPGDEAPVKGISPDNAWWAIQINPNTAPDGTGWVSAAYVTAYNSDNVAVIEPPPLPPDIDIPPGDGGEPTCMAIEPMNVRSGPGNLYPSYGKVSSGIVAEVIGVSPDGNWWVVVVPTSVAPDGQGWMSAAYCTGSNTDGVPVVAPPPLP